MELLIIIWIICGVLGYAVSSNPDKRVLGAVLGFLLGPLGVIAAAVLK
jgi:hypothetical protein